MGDCCDWDSRHRHPFRPIRNLFKKKGKIGDEKKSSLPPPPKTISTLFGEDGVDVEKNEKDVGEASEKRGKRL